MAEIKMRFRYCISYPGMLKWLEIIFCCVVLGLILWEAVEKRDVEHRRLLDGEQYTAIVALICIAVNLVFLAIFFLNCHMGPCVGCHCYRLSSAYYLLAFVAWLAAAGVEIYATIHFRDQKDDQKYHRRAAAAAFCFATAFLYLASVQQAKYIDL